MSPTLLPVVVVQRDVLHFILKGADVFLPGVIPELSELGKLVQDAYVRVE